VISGTSPVSYAACSTITPQRRPASSWLLPKQGAPGCTGGESRPHVSLGQECLAPCRETSLEAPDSRVDYQCECRSCDGRLRPPVGDAQATLPSQGGVRARLRNDWRSGAQAETGPGSPEGLSSQPLAACTSAGRHSVLRACGALSRGPRLRPSVRNRQSCSEGQIPSATACSVARTSRASWLALGNSLLRSVGQAASERSCEALVGSPA
jgi:hypothetical protein